MSSGCCTEDSRSSSTHSGKCRREAVAAGWRRGCAQLRHNMPLHLTKPRGTAGSFRMVSCRGFAGEGRTLCRSRLVHGSHTMAMSPIEPALPVPPHRSKGGVFITRAAQVSIPAGGLRISLSPGESQSSVTLHIALDMCPFWSEIAIDHLIRARDLRKEVISAWQDTDDDALANALIAECKAGMQAVVAGATAVDSFYGSISSNLAVPEVLRKSWQTSRTARYKRVVEVLRLAFKVRPRSAVAIRRALEEIYRFRGWAVHPPAKSREASLHPDLHMGTEWRFVAFSFPNARELTRGSLSLVSQAVNLPSKTNDAVQTYCDGLSALLAPTRARWQEAFGRLDPESQDGAQGAA